MNKTSPLVYFSTAILLRLRQSSVALCRTLGRAITGLLGREAGSTSYKAAPAS